MVSEPGRLGGFSRLVLVSWMICILGSAKILLVKSQTSAEVSPESSDEAQKQLDLVYARLNTVLVKLLKTEKEGKVEKEGRVEKDPTEKQRSAKEVRDEAKSEGNGGSQMPVVKEWWNNVAGLAIGVILDVGVWFCRAKFLRECDYQRRSHRTREVSSGRLDMYAVRYKPGSLKSWDSEVRDFVMRDLEVEVPDFIHRARLLWGLFDDSSLTRKTILNKLSQVIHIHTQASGLPIHSGTYSVDGQALWCSLEQALDELVVAKVSLSAVDAIRKMNRQLNESDLGFLRRVKRVFETSSLKSRESERVSVFFGKLNSRLQDKILENYNVEELGFAELIQFFNEKERDDEFKGLSYMRSWGTQKASSTSNVPQASRLVRYVNSELHRQRAVKDLSRAGRDNV